MLWLKDDSSLRSEVGGILRLRRRKSRRKTKKRQRERVVVEEDKEASRK